MKKVKFLLVSLISIFIFNINVFAASGSLSVSSSSVYVGDSFTVIANINAAAAWNVHVSASGPVSGCSINQADATADAMDTNKAFSATCTATGEGTITVVLSGDATSASDGNAINISGSRSVTVSTKPTPPSNNNEPANNQQTNNTEQNNNNQQTNNQNQNNNNQQTNDNKSTNNKIKNLSIDGYKLVKVDENNYTLSVPNDVTSININATTEDSKAKVTGLGKHDINIGENNIEIIVIAENGSQNKINIKITRKDDYYLDDLDSLLKNNKNEDINIAIKSDTKITTQDLKKIKSSKKTVNLNYYNDDKTLMYSWIIDGSKIKDTNDFVTTISSDSSNKKDMLKLSNYADGIFIELKQTDNIPAGTRIKYFVGNKYTTNDLINVYSYSKNNDKLNLINNKVKVENGYVTFDISEASDYLLTMSNIPNLEENIVTTGAKGNSSSKITIIIIGIISLIIMIITSVIIIKNKKKNNNKVVSKDDAIEQNNNNEKLDTPIITAPLYNQVNNENNIDELKKINFPEENINNNQQNIIFPNTNDNNVDNQNNNNFF